MVDITITAGNVLKGTGASTGVGTAGAAITAGDPLYADAADGFKLKPCIATSAAAAKCVGIALCDCADEQQVVYLTQGQITIGATVVVGQTYVVSAAAPGGIAPLADLVSTNFPTILGIAITNAIIDVLIHVGGVAKA